MTTLLNSSHYHVNALLISAESECAFDAIWSILSSAVRSQKYWSLEYRWGRGVGHSSGGQIFLSGASRPARQPVKPSPFVPPCSLQLSSVICQCSTTRQISSRKSGECTLPSGIFGDLRLYVVLERLLGNKVVVTVTAAIIHTTQMGRKRSEATDRTMSVVNLQRLPLISPRFGGGQPKESETAVSGKFLETTPTKISISGATTVSSSSFYLNGDAILHEVKLPKIVDRAEPLQSLHPNLTATNRSNSIESTIDTSEEVDTFTFDDLVEKRSLKSISGSCSASSSSSNSCHQSPSKPMTAKADRMGYLVECSESFLTVCNLGPDYKSHSIISLVKFTNPEKLQQQAYMLDSLASSGEAGKGVKWVAELSNTHLDTSYEVQVTLSSNSSDRVFGYDLDVQLRSIVSSARNSFLNNNSASMMCRQASNIVGGMKEQGLRILLVDDSMLVLKVVSRLIRGEGHAVDCKKDGIEALEALKNNEYDAVLMDIHMPEMGGLEASFEFRSHEGLMHQYFTRAQSAKLKIIAMSTDFSEALIKEVMSAGFDGFIAKPLTLAGFRELKLRPSLLRNTSCRVAGLGGVSAGVAAGN